MPISTKELLFIAFVTPPFFLVISTLFLVIKKPELIRKKSEIVKTNGPKTKLSPEIVSIIFYVLEELKNNKKYKPLYYMGIIGVIGTSILIIAFSVILYFF